MKRFNRMILTSFMAVLMFCGITVAVSAVDGVVWDGRAYPFYLLDPEKPNSESNPYIIDTAGKLANIAYLGIYDSSSLIKTNRNYFRTSDKKVKECEETYLEMKEIVEKNIAKGIRRHNKWYSDPINQAKARKEIDDKFKKPLEKAEKEYGISSQGLYGEESKGFHGEYFRITKDLNLNGSQFLWKTSYYFYGIIDGQGHVITNMRVTGHSARSDHYKSWANIRKISVGLFGTVGSISNLTLGYGCSVSFYEKNYIVDAGGFAGVGGSFTNCVNMATISVSSMQEIHAGGIAGSCRKLENCTNKGKITVIFAGGVKDRLNSSSDGVDVYNAVGGLAGECDKGRNEGDILNCHNTGKIEVKGACLFEYLSIGGLVGQNQCEKIVSNSDNAGSIEVTSSAGCFNIGGLVGFGEMSTLRNCYNKGSITGVLGGSDLNSLSYVGGIIGREGNVYNSYNSGTINVNIPTSNRNFVGGIGGGEVYAENCYNIGKISCLAPGSTINKVGGIIGELWGNAPGSPSLRLGVRNVFWLKSSCSDFATCDKYFPIGPVYSFNSDKSLIESKQNDELEGFVPDYNDSTVTLLQALNAWGDISLSKDKDKNIYLKGVNDSENYNKWIITGGNGGYPVLSNIKFPEDRFTN